MTKSERLFKEGIVEVSVYGRFEEAIITESSLQISNNARYLGTDFEAYCNGKKCFVDIYEHINKMYGVVGYYKEETK